MGGRGGPAGAAERVASRERADGGVGGPAGPSEMVSRAHWPRTARPAPAHRSTSTSTVTATAPDRRSVSAEQHRPSATPHRAATAATAHPTSPIAKLIHPGADFQTTSAGGICNITWDYDCSGVVETQSQIEACAGVALSARRDGATGIKVPCGTASTRDCSCIPLPERYPRRLPIDLRGPPERAHRRADSCSRRLRPRTAPIAATRLSAHSRDATRCDARTRTDGRATRNRELYGNNRRLRVRGAPLCCNRPV